MPEASVRGITMQYEWIGREDAPVLVLSSSLGTTLSLWEPQLEAFARFFRVLRYDMRGHGGSSVTSGPYSIKMLAQDLLGLLDELQVSSAAYCGISIGGVIGQWLAIHAPQRFYRMVFSNTAAKIGTSDGWNQRMEQVRHKGMSSVADAVVARWFTEKFMSAQPETIGAMRKMLLGCDPEGYTAACAAIRDMNLRALASSIRAPVCILGGAHDPATTMEDARWLHQQIAGSCLVELQTSHISNVEAATEFNAAVLQFLGEMQ
jgi:3-oxoadipate enol-lactonase